MRAAYWGTGGWIIETVASINTCRYLYRYLSGTPQVLVLAGMSNSRTNTCKSTGMTSAVHRYLSQVPVNTCTLLDLANLSTIAHERWVLTVYVCKYEKTYTESCKQVDKQSSTSLYDGLYSCVTPVITDRVAAQAKVFTGTCRYLQVPAGIQILAGTCTLAGTGTCVQVYL